MQVTGMSNRFLISADEKLVFMLHDAEEDASGD